MTDRQYLHHGKIAEDISNVSMMGELTEHRMINGPSLIYHLSRGSARMVSERADTTCHLRDENTDCEEEVKEVEINAPSSGYQMKSADRQQVAIPSLMREMILQKANLVQVVTALIQMQGVAVKLLATQ
ncbi:hypothetical protein HAX54_022132 [Datura stramonium]|uniref:Uncharacterized protein n=1 Tax=Datura stramonium TaxID=4076 RepID=A0ABS8S3U5_DATST|nr:hypothetical protein [Datura stramonium]